uniref:Arginine/serine-rich protein 1 n=1 Tax=Nothobranchius pienaari TaxID=704102 RepID=A0A1A8QCR3_9TELE
MAKHVDSNSEMAHARQTDGLNVIFDQKSPGSSRSRSRSVCSSASSRSTGSSYKGPENRTRYRSSSCSSSSSSSSSSSRSRSRSYPRCHRRSSRCYRAHSRSFSRSPPRRYRAHSRSFSRSPPRRYRAHSRSFSRSPPRRYRDNRSPPRRYRAYSPSYSRSPSPDRYSRHRRYYRSRSRSPLRWDRYRRPASQFRCSFSPPSRTYRRRSRSRSTERSVSLSLHDKRALLEAAQTNAMRLFGVEKLDLPESVKPILKDKPEPNRSLPEPGLRAKESIQRLSEVGNQRVSRILDRLLILWTLVSFFKLATSNLLLSRGLSCIAFPVIFGPLREPALCIYSCLHRLHDTGLLHSSAPGNKGLSCDLGDNNVCLRSNVS